MLFHSRYCSGISHPYTPPRRGNAVCTHSQDGRIRYQPLLFEVIFLTSRSFFVGSIDGLIFGNYYLHPTPSLTTPDWWVLLVRVLSSGVTSHTAHKTKPAPCLPSQYLHSGRPLGLRPASPTTSALLLLYFPSLLPFSAPAEHFIKYFPTVMECQGL